MKVRHVDWYADEWLGGTIEFGNAERGLYITACSLIYSLGHGITRAQLRAACRDHGHAFNRQLRILLASGKLVEIEGQITNKRCVNELQKAEERQVKAKQKGDKGGRPRKENNDIAKPTGFPDENLTTNLPTTNIPEARASGAQAPADPLKEMWKRGKALLGASAGALLGKAVKEHGHVVVLEAIIAGEKEGSPDPVAFFIGCLKQRGKSNGRFTPAADIYAGFAAALGEREADCQSDSSVIVPLLAGRRAGSA